MSAVSRQSWLHTLSAGMVLTLAGAAVQAAPLAEIATHPKSGKAAKGKAVHIIENRPVARSKAPVESRKTESPVLVPEKPAASEPSPLELKGVRG